MIAMNDPLQKANIQKSLSNLSNLKCNEHDTKIKYICSDTECLKTQKCLICPFKCYKSHKNDHLLDGKVIPASQIFSIEIYDDIEQQIAEQENFIAEEGKKIDNEIQKLEEQVIKLIKEKMQIKRLNLKEFLKNGKGNILEGLIALKNQYEKEVKLVLSSKEAKNDEKSLFMKYLSFYTNILNKFNLLTEKCDTSTEEYIDKLAPEKLIVELIAQCFDKPMVNGNNISLDINKNNSRTDNDFTFVKLKQKEIEEEIKNLRDQIQLKNQNLQNFQTEIEKDNHNIKVTVDSWSQYLKNEIDKNQISTQNSIKELSEVKQPQGEIIYAGKTSENSWQPYGFKTNGIVTTVDISALALKNIPIIITSIGGELEHWNAMGGSSVYGATNKSFKIYLQTVYGQDATVNFAQTKKWCVNYIIYSQD